MSELEYEVGIIFKPLTRKDIQIMEFIAGSDRNDYDLSMQIAQKSKIDLENVFSAFQYATFLKHRGIQEKDSYQIIKERFGVDLNFGRKTAEKNY